MDLNPDNGRPSFDFIFQVWRPAPDVNDTGCYGLVDDFSSTGIQTNQTIGVARITPLLADQLQFQPGDVLGFYVESNGSGSGPTGDADNGVVLLNSSTFTNEVVWYGSIGDGTAQMSSCLYPIGTTGVLSSSTHAAPAISISVMTYSCHQISSTTVASSISPTRSIQSTYSTDNSHPNESGSASMIGLISGVVTAFILACISAIAITTVIAFAVAKRHKKVVTLTHSSGIALSNQVYGELLIISLQRDACTSGLCT